MPFPQALALALTLVVEVPIYVGALSVGRILPPRFAAAMAIVVNLITHPVVWLTLSHIGGRWPVFVAAEVCAWLTETALFAAAVCAVARRRTAPDTALVLGLTALVANLASLVLGLALTSSAILDSRSL